MPAKLFEIQKVEANLKNLLETHFLGSVYFVDWDSTGITKKSTLLKFIALLGRLPIPASKAISIVSLVSDLVIKFREAEQEAKKQGGELLAAIEKILPTKNKKIHLIGHSLGSLVVHESLLTQQWSKSQLYLRSICYLGSAVRRHTDQSQHNSEFGKILKQKSKNSYKI